MPPTTLPPARSRSCARRPGWRRAPWAQAAPGRRRSAPREVQGVGEQPDQMREFHGTIPPISVPGSDKSGSVNDLSPAMVCSTQNVENSIQVFEIPGRQSWNIARVDTKTSSAQGSNRDEGKNRHARPHGCAPQERGRDARRHRNAGDEPRRERRRRSVNPPWPNCCGGRGRPIRLQGEDVVGRHVDGLCRVRTDGRSRRGPGRAERR